MAIEGVRSMGVLCFGPYEVRPATRELLRQGLRVKLPPQAFEVLRVLLERRGELVTRQEFHRVLWPADTFVDFDQGLNNAIKRIREVLNDSAEFPSYVETLPRLGYRFIGTVESVQADPVDSAGAKGSGSATAVQAVATGAGFESTAAAPLAARRKTTWRWWMLAALAAVLLVAVALVVHHRRLAADAPIHSLAVLPLEDLSPDHKEDYFADGLTDELITELAQIPALRVVSRTSVMQEKGKRRPVGEIARELGVEAVVEGSVLRSADRVRITAQLIDARSDRHLWAQTFEGPMGDILSLQDGVAREIATQTRAALTPADRTRLSSARSIQPEAYDDYLRGLYFIQRRDGKRAAQYFQSAIDLDPNWAPAWSGLSQAILTGEVAMATARPDDVMPTALRASQRAVEIDPGSGAAYIGLGLVEVTWSRDWAAAERDLQRGIALNPGDPLGHIYLSLYLAIMNRPDEAVVAARRAMDVDPLGFWSNRNLATVLFFDRRYDDALAALRRAAEIAPDLTDSLVENWISAIYEAQGRQVEAVDADLRQLALEFSPDEISALRAAFARGGWKAYQQTRIRFQLPYAADYCNAYDLGFALLRLGEAPQAFQWFQRGADEHCVMIHHLAADPRLDPFRQDPHYLALQDRLNLPH